MSSLPKTKILRPRASTEMIIEDDFPPIINKKNKKKKQPKAKGKKQTTIESSKTQEYCVEDILDKQIMDGIVKYYIKWYGWDLGYNTWEPIEHLTNCEQKLIDFEKNFKKKLKSQTSKDYNDTPRDRSPSFSDGNQMKHSKFTEINLRSRSSSKNGSLEPVAHSSDTIHKIGSRSKDKGSLDRSNSNPKPEQPLTVDEVFVKGSTPAKKKELELTIKARERKTSTHQDEKLSSTRGLRSRDNSLKKDQGKQSKSLEMSSNPHTALKTGTTGLSSLETAETINLSYNRRDTLYKIDNESTTEQAEMTKSMKKSLGKASSKKGKDSCRKVLVLEDDENNMDCEVRPNKDAIDANQNAYMETFRSISKEASSENTHTETEIPNYNRLNVTIQQETRHEGSINQDTVEISENTRISLKFDSSAKKSNSKDTVINPSEVIDLTEESSFNQQEVSAAGTKSTKNDMIIEDNANKSDKYVGPNTMISNQVGETALSAFQSSTQTKISRTKSVYKQSYYDDGLYGNKVQKKLHTSTPAYSDTTRETSSEPKFGSFEYSDIPKKVVGLKYLPEEKDLMVYMEWEPREDGFKPGISSIRREQAVSKAKNLYICYLESKLILYTRQGVKQFDETTLSKLK